MKHLLHFLIICPFLLFSQEDAYKDSLELALQNTQNFDDKKELLFLLGEHLEQRNPEKAEEISNDLSTNYLAKGDSSGIARNRSILAASNRWRGNYHTALENYNKNYNYYKSINDSLNTAISSHLIGSINMFIGNNVLSQKHLLEAAALYEKVGSPKQKTHISNSLAGFYINIDQWEKARDKYLEGLEQCEKIKDSVGLASINANLGMVYTELGDYEKAEKHLMAQKNYNVIFPTKREMGFHYDFLGNLRQAQGRKQEAYQEHLTALKIRKNLSSTYNLCESLINTSDICIELGKYDEAIGYLRQVFDFEEHQSLTQQQAAYELLADAHEKKGNSALALVNYKNFKKITDSIYNKESIDIIAEKDAAYKKQEQDTEIALLNKENELKESKLSRSRFIMWGSLLGFLMLGAFAYYVYRSSQKIKEKNIEIRKALNEKELLMKEIHHRVKNNLQIVSSLLTLQSNYIDDKMALEALQKGRNRVDSMAILHRNLYSEENITNVDMKSYLKSLVDNIFNTYNISDKDIDLKMDLDEVKLDVDTVIPIGLIINELITNSLKHAFEEGKEIKSLLEVKLKDEKDNLLLVVKDNGKGISQEVLDREKTESFGQSMVRAFVKKLKADLKVNTKEGTEISVFIPKVG